VIAGSGPGHHLELRRPGGREAVAHAIDVWRREVDAQQHGAVRDLALQRFSTLLGQAGRLEYRREAAGDMPSSLPQLRGQRSGRHDWPDPWHHQGDGRQHTARQFSQARRRPRILKVYPGSRVHLISKDPRVGMTLRDDRDVLLADTQGMKRGRGLGCRGRVRKQREREWVGHSRYLTLKRSLDLESGDRCATNAA
jgi:hypothetical protein